MVAARGAVSSVALEALMAALTVEEAMVAEAMAAAGMVVEAMAAALMAAAVLEAVAMEGPLVVLKAAAVATPAAVARQAGR